MTTQRPATGEIRQGITFADFTPVFKVFEGYPFEEVWSNEAMQQEYDSFQVEDGTIFGYYLDGKCVGILTFRPLTPGQHPVTYDPNDKVMYLSDIAVIGEYQGKGIASQLLHHGIRHLKVLGYKHVYLRTTEEDDSLERLYQKIGFCRIWDLCQEVERLRTDGTVRKDLRFFMQMELAD